MLDVVNSLEVKVYKLLQKLEEASRLNEQLSEELAASKKEQVTLHEALRDWEERYNSLKIANSMLGSTKDKSEAKLKINTLIREIDQCIVQLNE